MGLTLTALVTVAGLVSTAGSAQAGATDPDFGPNVFIYDPSTPTATIAAKLNQLHDQQADAQFSDNRYAILFKPGQYQVDANLGYYETVAGLGLSPDDTNITGAVRVTGYPDPTSPAGISALENFWRSASNLSITPTDWSDQWAVSQAAPLRRVHIKGILWLEPGNGGYSSGGYIADSKVDGITINGSQQQWLTRDSDLGGIWTNGVWNQVFSGVTGATPAPDYPNNPYTVLPTSPVTREAPFLYVDNAGNYRVFLPALRHNTSGTTWDHGQPGRSVSISTFYIAKPGDSAGRLNLELALGKNLIFTPGVYHLRAPLMVTRKDTVIMGLGMPSLTPDNGTAAIRIADVDGVRVSGLIVDAGPKNSRALVDVGSGFSHRGHAADPTSLQDVFFRVGGPWAGRATASLVVNSDDTLLDDIWAWRADHGNGVGWTANTAEYGVVVNGDDVTAYGLFVEHYQKYQTVWNGQHGTTIFYQSEMPYDPPSQAAWTSHTGLGYASYKVAPWVTSHQAYGLGVYCYFNQGVDIRADRAIEVPDRPGVVFTHMVSVFLSGSGGIERTINDVGTPEVGSFGTSYVVQYPS